jgi:ABC-2 type transport system ATP-binding protein
MADFIASAWSNKVRVVSPDATALAGLLAAPEVTVTSSSPTELLVEGVPAADIGDLAARHALPLHELVPLHPSLEEAFMELTKESVQYHGRTDGALLTADAVR